MTLLVVAGSLLLLLIAVLVIVWPLLQQDEEELEAEAGSHLAIEADPLSELGARRDSVYEAIRDLRFDYQVGKVSEADFQIFDGQLKSQAVGVLKQIDELNAAESDPDLDARLEAEIVALRRNGHSPAAARAETGAAAGFCAKCGNKLKAGDRFCGKCGAMLA